MFAEDDLLPLSGLPHMMFCERRWALIQIENVWEENRFTAEGTVLHEKAHSGDIESRPGVLIRRTVALRSFRLGLSGQADIVEFVPAKAPESGVALGSIVRAGALSGGNAECGNTRGRGIRRNGEAPAGGPVHR
jgi:CRISPR-associated exonuclease Cas4